MLFVLHAGPAVLSVPCSLVVTCWERAYLLALLYVMFSCVFVTFPYGVLVQMWYLIVSIPDLCLLLYLFLLHASKSLKVSSSYRWQKHTFEKRPVVNFESVNITCEEVVKLLGEYLSFDHHISNNCKKAAQQLNAMRRIEHNVKLIVLNLPSNENSCSL